MTTIDDAEAVNRSPREAELTGAARALVPELLERGREIDELRRAPEDLVAGLRDRGLVDLANPWAHGGEGEYDLALAVTYELGQGSGSVAWCHAVWSQHNWMLGLWPAEAQEEYFAPGPGVLCSSAFNPAGAKVAQVDGGFRLSGRWSFSSGCDHANWAMLAGFLESGKLAYMLVPKDDYAIDDTWFVSGLKGTGSKDVVVEDAFVPAHRVATAAHLSEPRTTTDRPSYALPIWPLVSLSLSYAVMGMARGAYTAFATRLAGGGKNIAGAKPADLPATQLRLAEADVELGAAKLLCDRSVEDMLRRARSGELPGLDERTGYARDRAYAIRLSVRAVNRLFEVSGASGLYDDAAIQRFHRDVHAGSHQPAHSWDTYAVHFGRQRLGLDLGPTARLI